MKEYEVVLYFPDGWLGVGPVSRRLAKKIAEALRQHHLYLQRRKRAAAKRRGRK